jgi:hypothetical protein
MKCKSPKDSMVSDPDRAGIVGSPGRINTKEFFEGVLFLTTNRLNDIDAAILNRIHLKLEYDNLDKSGRKAMITQFLKPIAPRLEPSNISEEYPGEQVQLKMI